jgi:hypothetical protein
MKKIWMILGVFICLTSFTVTQSDTEEVVKGLKTGNAEQVSAYFDAYLDLTLPGKEEIKNIGKNQAGITLQTFFTEIGVKGFELTSQRESGLMMYITGKLQTKSKGYNVTILLKNKEGKHFITSVRIN